MVLVLWPLLFQLYLSILLLIIQLNRLYSYTHLHKWPFSIFFYTPFGASIISMVIEIHTCTRICILNKRECVKIFFN